MRADDRLDEVYERLAVTGPEFDGWLSNHGPMAGDALLRMGQAERVHAWLEAYARRLEPLSRPRWSISEQDWREPLGDPGRLGDWLALFACQVEERPWQELLAIWWPRLLPGGIASATHALIRTGHAVRALGEADTAPRRAELAQALGYWAARWQPLPRQQHPSGTSLAPAALRLLPRTTVPGGIRERLAELGQVPGWPAAQAHLRPVTEPGAVPAALDDLVDTTVSRYASTAHQDPVMLVHASTAPRAARLALAALPQEMWIPTYEQAWSIVAAITALYAADESTRESAPESPAEGPTDGLTDGPTEEPTETLAERTTEGPTETDIAAAAAEHGDEHAIKFTEVAIESHRRGNAASLPAARQAHRLI
jgi:hypothetical protein